jgi:hypothetical protein
MTFVGSLESTPLQGPCDRLFLASELGAQVATLWPDADTTKIQSICIPATQHGDVAFRQTQFMVADRLMKECKIRVAQVEGAFAKGSTEFGSPLAVARIPDGNAS